MRNIVKLLSEIVEKKTGIEQCKAEHPEMAELIQMVDEYVALLDEYYREAGGLQQAYPYPNPMYPSFPLWVDCVPFKLTTSTGTGESQL